MVVTGQALGDPVITGWSTVSPLGMRTEELTAGLRVGRRAVTTIDWPEWSGPVSEACLIPGFTVAGALGGKGTRSMDRATGIAVSAVGVLLNRQRLDRGGDTDNNIGLVLGTSTGSAQSIMDFTRDSLTQEKPFYVDPARFPNTVMNCAAGQCAIWHQLKGPNTTIAGGHVTGLLALSYAVRLQRSGYVDVILCGAVEEFSVQRSWLEWHARATANGDGRPGRPLGEGCAVFLLESADSARRHGRAPVGYAPVLEFGIYGPHVSLRAALTRCVAAALARAGLYTADVWAISHSETDDSRGEEERDVLEQMFGHASPTFVLPGELIGDTSSASAAFQLAAVLAAAQDDARARGRAAVITSIDRDGVIGCAVVRTP